MNFSKALEMLKKGERLERTTWNGKGMFIFLVDGSKFNVNRPPLMGIFPEGTEINYNPHIDICTVDGSIAVWQPSNGDMLSNDWKIV